MIVGLLLPRYIGMIIDLAKSGGTISQLLRPVIRFSGLILL
jgi:hypothetical protein